ncbi:MAG: hypothetical protein ACETWK_02465 [Candidatus Aminicenantaceae bacterium]
MEDKKIYSTVKIRKRRWYTWILWFLWLAWVFFWAEGSLGSWKEMESRASVISLLIFSVSLCLGVLVWLMNCIRSKKQNLS